MNVAEKEEEVSAKTLPASAIAMRLEVVVIPVSDVDRAKRFYSHLDWRLDIDYRGDDAWIRMLNHLRQERHDGFAGLSAGIASDRPGRRGGSRRPASARHSDQRMLP